MKLFVTGAAGFIGFHLVKKLAEEKHDIVCIDNINNYYDVDLKYGRLAALGIKQNAPDIIKENEITISTQYPHVKFGKFDLCDTEQIVSLFSENSFDIVIHLAAQAGVRYSLANPHAYISGNIQGFLNILEAARLYPSRHLIYASSSSVYGLNAKTPFSETDEVNQPASLYAATKRANELMAFTYNHLYHIPVTGLRFFTVYGPWGRPDMAPFIFTKSIIEGQPINVFNNGNMKRDFTYIDDVIDGIMRVVKSNPAENEKNHTSAVLYNIGNGKPVPLMDFINTLEKALDKKAIIKYAPMQMGDINSTWADCSAIEHDTGFRPQTTLVSGIQKFAAWYKEYYKEK